MSSLEDRRNSPPPRPNPPRWQTEVLAIAIAIAFLAAALAGVFLGHAIGVYATEPAECLKLANVMPLAGDCR